MMLFPAIDLKDGRCVRLRQGDFDDVTVYGDDPLAVAKAFQASGAKALHVVDLDGAREGSTRQTEIIRRIAGGTSLEVQVGGGLRNWADVEALLAAGVKRVVLGSLAVKDISGTKTILTRAGAEAVVLALDVKLDTTGNPVVMTHGWREGSGVTLWDLLDEYEDSGLKYVLCTDVGRDGMLMGPNLNLYRTMSLHYPGIRVLASGGIGSIGDLKALREMGAFAAVVGKALYEKRFTLEEAISC